MPKITVFVSPFSGVIAVLAMRICVMSFFLKQIIQMVFDWFICCYIWIKHFCFTKFKSWRQKYKITKQPNCLCPTLPNSNQVGVTRLLVCHTPHSTTPNSQTFRPLPGYPPSTCDNFKHWRTTVKIWTSKCIWKKKICWSLILYFNVILFKYHYRISIIFI